jgi:proline iminopeptidase
MNEMVKQNIPINFLYDKVWSLVDTKAVDRLLFENQEVVERNRKLWDESQLTNTGLMRLF